MGALVVILAVVFLSTRNNPVRDPVPGQQDTQNLDISGSNQYADKEEPQDSNEEPSVSYSEEVPDPSSASEVELDNPGESDNRISPYTPQASEVR